MNPEISIIIPCYNSGRYLPEALQSVLLYPAQKSIQVIIVDDGSTDEQTLQFLESLDRNVYTVIHQENRGPAAARNTGAREAKAEFLLFLDSDNKIRPGYIDAGVAVLKDNPEVGVVYGNADFFGDTDQPRFKSKPFDIFTLLMGNYIDVCSVVRKKAFDDVNGFDESRILFGHEDWELWIRIHSHGWKFHFIDEVFFDYRVRGNSLLMQKSEADNLKEVLRFVYSKHLDLFIEQQEKLKYQYEFYLHDKRKPFRTFLKSVHAKIFKQHQRV